MLEHTQKCCGLFNEYKDKNMGHKHAENMRLYSEDAVETNRPWERWEYYMHEHDLWTDCCGHPAWHDNTEYRRKPKTILINGICVPEPVRGKLAYEQRYYTPSQKRRDLFDAHEWSDSKMDNNILKAGFVHLTKEAAIKHAEALLSFTRIDDDQPQP